MTLFATSTISARFDIVRLERACWRISDASLDEADPAYVLAFIERLGRRRYEVLWLGAPIGWGYVESFDEAVWAICDRARFSGSVELQRGETAQSRSPRLFHRDRRRQSFEAP